ncbi:MAG: APC family permease [Acidilobaceae archaeon]
MILGRLSSPVLTVRENYAQAMAVTAPLGSVISTTTVAVAYAGNGVILATILAFIASAFWVYTLTIYSRRIASAGGYYTFVYAAYRNRALAFTEAIIELSSFIFLNAVNVMAIYLMISSLLKFYGFREANIILPFILGFSLLYPTIVSYVMHIRRLLGTIVIIVATLEVLLLIALFIVAIRYGFKFDILIPPPDVSLASLALAFIIILVSIDGVGTATYLGEETRKPLDNVTKGMWLAFIIGGLSMIAGTYAMIALWPSTLSLISYSEQPLIDIMAGYGLIPAVLVIIIATKSLLISNIGTTVAAARILFNLSREKAAPEIFQYTNKYKQPHIATLTVGIVTIIITITSLELLGAREAFIQLGAVTGILWILGRVIDSAGAPLLLHRLSEVKLSIKNRGVAIPVITTILNSIGLLVSTLDITITSILMLASITIVGLTWYTLIARYGMPGELVIDNNSNIVKLEDYINIAYKRSNNTVN